MRTAKAHRLCLLLGLLVFMACACGTPYATTPAVSITVTPELLLDIPGITYPAPVFPCSIGIWDTLEFGVTTEEQLAQWLTQSEYVHRPSLREGWVEESVGASKRHRYIWNVKDEGIYRTSMRLYVTSGTLSSLWTPFFYPITLETIVTQLGPPQAVSVYLDQRHEEWSYTYEFYYPGQGIVVSGTISDPTLCGQINEQKIGLLEPTWPVLNLSCNAPGTLVEVVQSMYGISIQASEDLAELTQLWKGFGESYSLNP